MNVNNYNLTISRLNIQAQFMLQIVFAYNNQMQNSNKRPFQHAVLKQRRSQGLNKDSGRKINTYLTEVKGYRTRSKKQRLNNQEENIRELVMNRQKPSVRTQERKRLSQFDRLMKDGRQIQENKDEQRTKLSASFSSPNFIKQIEFAVPYNIKVQKPIQEEGAYFVRKSPNSAFQKSNLKEISQITIKKETPKIVINLDSDQQSQKKTDRMNVANFTPRIFHQLRKYQERNQLTKKERMTQKKREKEQQREQIKKILSKNNSGADPTGYTMLHKICRQVQNFVFEQYKNYTATSLRVMSLSEQGNSDCKQLTHFVQKQFRNSFENSLRVSIGETATKCQASLGEVIKILGKEIQNMNIAQ